MKLWAAVGSIIEVVNIVDHKMCGFFGCHVGNQGECDCTKCSPYQTLCNDCVKFPNRARNDAFLFEAMQNKCDMCRGAIQEAGGNKEGGQM